VGSCGRIILMEDAKEGQRKQESAEKKPREAGEVTGGNVSFSTSKAEAEGDSQESSKTVLLVFLGLVGFAIIAYGSYWAARQLSAPGALQTTPTPSDKNIQSTIQPTEEATPTDSETAGWEVYINEELGYRVRYPENWFLEESSQRTSFSNWDAEKTLTNEEDKLIVSIGLIKDQFDYNSIRSYLDEERAKFEKVGGGPGPAAFIEATRIAGNTAALVKYPKPGVLQGDSKVYFVVSNTGQLLEVRMQLGVGTNIEDFEPTFEQFLSTLFFTEPAGSERAEQPSAVSATYDLVFYTFPIGESNNKTYWRVNQEGGGLGEFHGQIPIQEYSAWERRKMELADTFREAIDFPKEEGTIFVSVLAEDDRHVLILTSPIDSENANEDLVWSYDMVDGSTRQIMSLLREEHTCSQIIGWSYSNQEIYAMSSELKGTWSGGLDYLKSLCVYDDRTGEKVRNIDLPRYQYSWGNYQVDPKNGFLIASGYGSPTDAGKLVLVNLCSGGYEEIVGEGYNLRTGWRKHNTPLDSIILMQTDKEEEASYKFNIYNLNTQKLSKKIVFEKKDNDGGPPRPVDLSPNGKLFLFQHLVFSEGGGEYCWFTVSVAGRKDILLCEKEFSNEDVGSGFSGWLEK